MLDSAQNQGLFEFRPLEPGFGLTVGNALRRVLLSSLEGFAITSSLTNNTQSNDWLEWNSDMMKGTIKTFPERSQISENIKEQLIVEIYSK